MKVSAISKTPTRPRIRRMSQRDLQEINTSNEFESTSMSANKQRNRRPSQVGPERSNSWKPNDGPQDLNNSWRPSAGAQNSSSTWRQNGQSQDIGNSWRPDDRTSNRYDPWRPNGDYPRNFNDPENNKCFLSKGWLWFFGVVFCLILLIAIVGIVLGIVLPMQTTTAPDSDATQKMAIVDSNDSQFIVCSDTDRGSIITLNESISSGWTSYSYNYSATQTTSTLLFGFKTDSIHEYYLDDVSVVDINTPSIELLTNPSFEDSTIYPTDWMTSCERTCASQIISGSQCYGSSGNCFMAYCTANSSSIAFLSQSFLTTIGNLYTISFMLNQAGNSSFRSMSFYLDVI